MPLEFELDVKQIEQRRNEVESQRDDITPGFEFRTHEERRSTQQGRPALTISDVGRLQAKAIGRLFKGRPNGLKPLVDAKNGTLTGRYPPPLQCALPHGHRM
jgi:hypothetical protein